MIPNASQNKMTQSSRMVTSFRNGCFTCFRALLGALLGANYSAQTTAVNLLLATFLSLLALTAAIFPWSDALAARTNLAIGTANTPIGNINAGKRNATTAITLSNVAPTQTKIALFSSFISPPSIQ
jgi:hypothetical protein